MELSNGHVDEIEAFLKQLYLDRKVSISQSKNPKVRNTKLDRALIDILSMIIPFSPVDIIELKSSKIHGNGVFAKQHIKKGALVTFCPGDIIEYTPNGDRHLEHHKAAIYTSQRFYNLNGDVNHSQTKNTHRNNDYAYNVDNHYTIIGNVDFKEDPSYLGHFINDGAKTDCTSRADQIYNKISLLKSNCKFHPIKNLHVAILATKDIHAGDELFLPYGIGYWRSHKKTKEDILYKKNMNLFSYILV